MLCCHLSNNVSLKSLFPQLSCHYSTFTILINISSSLLVFLKLYTFGYLFPSFPQWESIYTELFLSLNVPAKKGVCLNLSKLPHFWETFGMSSSGYKEHSALLTTLEPHYQPQICIMIWGWLFFNSFSAFGKRTDLRENNIKSESPRNG